MNSGTGTRRQKSRFGVWFIVVISLFAMAACKTQYPSPEKPHHTPDGFTNPLGHEERGLADFLKWQWGRMFREIPGPETYGFALAKNDPAFLQSNGEKTTLTWIGHATVLLQLKGRNILTDPHFSERASPVSWTGPRRAVPPGVALEDLPEIHAVLISHDHYDSLDRTTIRRLRNRPGGEHTVFFVPLGLQAWFEDLGVTRVVELDWWGRHVETGLEVVAVPVQHWSKRGLIGRNRTLWAGWVVRRGGFSFFFVGDSGYTPLFKEIGRRLGPFDLTAIPIGAYEPRWFMGLHHMNPEEAVQVHLDVRSRKSVSIHWGTFALTDEPLDEPPLRLAEARAAQGVSDADFLVLQHGQTIRLD